MPLEQLSICDRVTDVTGDARAVAIGFEALTIGDCRVNWVTTLYYDSSIGLNVRADFIRELVAWSMGLWGCLPPPEGFALLHHAVPLGAADAATLIDFYVDISTEILTLSPREIADMRTILEAHAAPLVAEAGEEGFLSPNCDEPGAGGAGGGGPGGEGGAAGAGQAGDAASVSGQGGQASGGSASEPGTGGA